MILSDAKQTGEPVPKVPLGGPSTSDHPQSASSMVRIIREPIDFVLVLLIAATIFKGFVAEGYYVPSGSMAPGLVGFHHRAACPSCGERIIVGRDPGDWIPPSVSCPQCQHQVPLKPDEIEPGDRLLVLKGAYDLRPPKRWETVVFRRPSDADQAYVKRCIGLPGEEIRIRGGDIYVNGRRAQKSWDTLMAMVLPVYDHDRASQASDYSPRFQADGGGSAWKETGPTIELQAPAQGESSRLVYHHMTASGREDAISDDQVYNADRAEGAIRTVRDLVISGAFEHHRGEGSFQVTYRIGARERLSLLVNPTRGTVELHHNGRQIRAGQVTPWPGAKRSWALGFWDGTAGMRWEGKAVWEDLPLAIPLSDEPGSSEPVEMSGQKIHMAVHHFRIDRDVYYRAMPRSLAEFDEFHEPVVVGPDEYFVLGDNSPVSNDGRSWEIQTVPARLFIGKPMFVHLPMRTWRGNILGRSFQLPWPDVERIKRIQ